MRLIDADELLTDPYFKDETIPERAMFIEAVEDSRTVDAKPIKHGKWIEEKYETTSNRKINNTKNICSVCLKSNGKNKTNYCPNCGTKMDE